jgi:hypothetical protein
MLYLYHYSLSLLFLPNKLLNGRSQYIIIETFFSYFLQTRTIWRVLTGSTIEFDGFDATQQLTAAAAVSTPDYTSCTGHRPSSQTTGTTVNRARIFKLLRSPRIDSKEPMPPGCVAWRADTTTLSPLASEPP